MNQPLVMAAEREREQIKKKMATWARRLEELDTFLRISATIEATDEDLFSVVDRAVDDAHEALLTAKTSRALTIKDQVIRTCAEIISSNGKPLQTHELVQGLESRGIVLNGKSKILQVSAILSREKELFRSDRKKGGWSLKHPRNGEGPGAQTPEPSSRQRPRLSAAGRQPHP